MASPATHLFRQDCRFVAGAATPQRLPAPSLPEVAFIGRSNVGKSSLINTLVNRKDLARTSKTPGRTQQLNFFNLGEQLMLVDLPGYGYAKASKSAVAEWNQLISYYLRNRSILRRVCVLIDSRHGLKENDIGMMRMLDEHAVPYQIVLTKTDKQKKPQEIIDGVEAVRADHAALHPQILLSSSVNAKGIEDVREALYELTQN
jgi:GTP-binding protein